MVVAGDFRNGLTFDMDGDVYQVIEFQHVKPGKGAAFVRTKMKNIMTGAVTERTFNPTDKFENAYIETWEETLIPHSQVEDNFKFVKEEMMCKISSYKGRILGVEPPTFVELEIVSTEPGFAGNTATNTLKPATLETGAVIKVPLFINEGERVKIDTRTGEYLSRA